VNTNDRPSHVVVKVGGSLFHRQETLDQAIEWINTHTELGLIVICGGGRLADVIRGMDKELNLGESLSHQLAIQTMRMNLTVLSSRFQNARIATRLDEIQTHSYRQGPLFFDLEPWHLTARMGPQIWENTSDSIAAALAVESQASELVLLKSAGPAAGQQAETVFQSDLVDPEFSNWTARLRAIRIIVLGSASNREWTWRNSLPPQV